MSVASKTLRLSLIAVCLGAAVLLAWLLVEPAAVQPEVLGPGSSVSADEFSDAERPFRGTHAPVGSSPRSANQQNRTALVEDVASTPGQRLASAPEPLPFVVSGIVREVGPFRESGDLSDVGGPPVPGATVVVAVRDGGSMLFLTETFADQRGAYSVEAHGIRRFIGSSLERRIRLHVEAHSIEHKPTGWFVALDATENFTQTLDLDLRPVTGTSLRGRLCDADGKPLNGVSISSRAPRTTQEQSSGLGGWFVLDNMPSVGEMTLHAESTAEGSLDEAFALETIGPRCNLGDLRMIPRGVVAGRVIGLAGAGLEGERVIAKDLSVDGFKTSVIKSGVGGAFRFMNLDPDHEYQLGTTLIDP